MSAVLPKVDILSICEIYKKKTWRVSLSIGVRNTMIRWVVYLLRILKMFHGLMNNPVLITNCRSQWPRGLRRRSAAARLLRFWVRMPPGGMDVSVVGVVCCQVEVSATSWSFVRWSSVGCGASLCVTYKPREWGGPGPLGSCRAKNKQCSIINVIVISLFHRAFFNSIIDKHQHMHFFTFNTVLI